MHKRILRSLGGLLVTGGAMMLAVGCAEDPTVPSYSEGALALEIVAGPDASSAVAHGSKVTFKWQPSGGAGSYSYEYKIDSGSMVAVTAGQTSVIISDANILTEGDHVFTLVVTDGSSNSVTATRNFKMSAEGAGDTSAPTIEVVFPPAGFVSAPGATVRFAWTVADESNATEAGVVAGVDSVGWSVDDPNVTVSAGIPLTGYADNVALGQHVLYVRAVDASGNATTITDTFSVIEPTIFIVDETVLEPGYDGHQEDLSLSQAFGRETWLATILAGYAYEVWVVADQGYPGTGDVPATAEALVWIGSGDIQNSSWGWNVGYEYSWSNGANPNIITDAIDAGLGVWIMGENWLEEIGWSGAALDSTLEYDYLGFVLDEPTVGCMWELYHVNAITYDFTPVDASAFGVSWPTLASDIAKLPGGLGDWGDWSVDVIDTLRTDVTPIYKVLTMADEGGAAGPPESDEWYVAWAVDDAAGDPQVVMMTMDLNYFSTDNARAVAQNVLTGLFGQ